MKKYIVRLTNDEREELSSCLRQGRLSYQKSQRARILLKADQSEGKKWLTDEEISVALEVAVPTVERTRKRFVEEGFAACLHNAKRTQPPYNLKVDGDLEAQILMITCSEPPSGRSRWTLSLIADQLVELRLVDSISDETVRLSLKKTRSSHGRKNSGA